jgi:hypothetical protein
MLAPLSKEGFGIVAETGPGTITVRLSGSCDSHTTASLDRFLSDLHLESLRTRAKTVTLDCENLYFMNSAAVKCFVILLTKIKALPPANRYHILVRTNRHLTWQQRSFGAISRSAPDILTVDV